MMARQKACDSTRQRRARRGDGGTSNLGLYYTSTVSRGREVGFYDGEVVTREEYVELDEYTGLRHTLEIGGGGRAVGG